MVFLFVFLLIIFLLIFSKIRIEIINLGFSSVQERHLNKDYKIIFKLYILNIIPLFKINISKTKLEKLKIKEKIKNIDLKLIEKNIKFDKKILKAIKKFDFDIKKIKLNIDIGTENASVTSIIIAVLSTLIALSIRKKVENYKEQEFFVRPIYTNQNVINILISGIFEIKMIHIINIIYILNKKEGVKEHERTSNRRSYGYSYE